MKKYELIIFDFDGTIADSFNWFCKSLNICARKFNFNKIGPEDIDRLRRSSAREIMSSLGIYWWKRPFVANHMRKLMKNEINSIHLFEGIEDVIRSLSQNSTLAIVSSNSEENIKTVLGKKNSDLFSHYVCGVSLFGKKKHLSSLLKKTQIDAKMTLYIGDETRDYEAVTPLMIDFGAALWGYSAEENLLKLRPTHFFNFPRDIIKKLQIKNKSS